MSYLETGALGKISVPAQPPGHALRAPGVTECAMASSAWPAQALQGRRRANPAWCYLRPEAEEMVWVGIRVAPNLLKIGAEPFGFLGYGRSLQVSLHAPGGTCH